MTEPFIYLCFSLGGLTLMLLVVVLLLAKTLRVLADQGDATRDFAKTALLYARSPDPWQAVGADAARKQADNPEPGPPAEPPRAKVLLDADNREWQVVEEQGKTFLVMGKERVELLS